MSRLPVFFYMTAMNYMPRLHLFGRFFELNSIQVKIQKISTNSQKNAKLVEISRAREKMQALDRLLALSYRAIDDLPLRWTYWLKSLVVRNTINPCFLQHWAWQAS